MHQIPQSAHATSLKEERRSILQRLADPAHGQSAKNMAVSDDEHVSMCDCVQIRRVKGGLVPLLADLVNEAVEPFCDLLWAPEQNEIKGR